MARFVTMQRPTSTVDAFVEQMLGIVKATQQAKKQKDDDDNKLSQSDLDAEATADGIVSTNNATIASLTASLNKPIQAAPVQVSQEPTIPLNKYGDPQGTVYGFEGSGEYCTLPDGQKLSFVGGNCPWQGKYKG